MKCPITGEQLYLLYDGPVRHGGDGTYVPGKVWYHQKWDMAMLDPDNRISSEQYASGEYRARLGQGDPDSRRGKTDVEAFINARYLFPGRGENCVDFGAGNGSFLDAVSGMYETTTAVESERACWATMQRHHIAERIEGLLSGSADAVYSLQTLEHVEDWVYYLAEMARITKPGGQIGICVPAFAGWYVKDKPESWLKDYYVTHHNWYLSPRAFNYAAGALGMVTLMEHITNVGAKHDRLYMRFGVQG